MVSFPRLNAVNRAPSSQVAIGIESVFHTGPVNDVWWGYGRLCGMLCELAAQVLYVGNCSLMVALGVGDARTLRSQW